jgi:hypothetical protein
MPPTFSILSTLHPAECQPNRKSWLARIEAVVKNGRPDSSKSVPAIAAQRLGCKNASNRGGFERKQRRWRARFPNRPGTITMVPIAMVIPDSME